jgi:hypothetical protein
MSTIIERLDGITTTVSEPLGILPEGQKLGSDQSPVLLGGVLAAPEQFNLHTTALTFIYSHEANLFLPLRHTNNALLSTSL